MTDQPQRLESDPPETDARAYVLLLDDEPAMLQILGRVFAKRDLASVPFEDPKAALAALREGIRVDAVVTDQTMPHMTGVEFATQVRRLRPELPILLMSGNLDAGLLEHEGLFDGYISKPFRLEPLLELLDGLLESRPQRTTD